MGILERIRKLASLYTNIETEGALKAFILISMRLRGAERKKEVDIAKELAKISFVKRVWIVAGEWDLMLYVEAPMDILSDFIVRKLRGIEEIEKTKTIFVFEEIQ